MLYESSPSHGSTSGHMSLKPSRGVTQEGGHGPRCRLGASLGKELYRLAVPQLAAPAGKLRPLVDGCVHFHLTAAFTRGQAGSRVPKADRSRGPVTQAYKLQEAHCSPSTFNRQ